MTYDIQWTNETRAAVYLVFNGGWNVDEWTDAQHVLGKMLSEVGSPVSIVLHLAEPRTLPMNIIHQIRDTVSLTHPNRANTVMVVPPPIIPAFKEIMRRSFSGTMPDYIAIIDSLDDAKKYFAASA